MYLLDTNVISELRKLRAGRADRSVAAWADGADSSKQFLSVVTLLEIEMGALSMERKDARRGALLRSWIDHRVMPEFDGRILPVDVQIVQRCAQLHVPNPCSYRDSLIAATALVHRMTLVTRNVDDFARTGVLLLNPWER